MAPRSADPLAPEIGFHPYRAVYRLPFAILPGGSWTQDQPGVASGHSGVDALMSLPGVAIVSLRDDRLTVIRDPGTAWDSILGAVRPILEEHFLARPEPFTPG